VLWGELTIPLIGTQIFDLLVEVVAIYSLIDFIAFLPEDCETIFYDHSIP
jgi:hypothetical protein